MNQLTAKERARILACLVEGNSMRSTQRMKLDPFNVETIAHLPSWSTVPFALMMQFISACGIDFCDWRKMHRVNAFLARQSLRDNPWRHLRRSKQWLSYYEPLLKLYATTLK